MTDEKAKSLETSEGRDKLVLHVGRLTLVLEGAVRTFFVFAVGATSSLLVGLLDLPGHLIVILSIAVAIAVIVAFALATRAAHPEAGWLISVAYWTAAFLLLFEVHKLLSFATRSLAK